MQTTRPIVDCGVHYVNVVCQITDARPLRVHRASGDQMIELPEEPGHQVLCDAGQGFVLRAIAEDIDLTRHMQDAVQNQAICLAADENIREARVVDLKRFGFPLKP